MSRTTVSDVLNRGDAAELYADETRQRVADAVRVLGYAPSTTAQKLARGRSGLIGLVLLRDFSNPYFARFADSVDREVRRRGMRLQLSVRDCAGVDDEECSRRDAQLIRQMQADAVEGLLVGPIYEELDLHQHNALTRGQMPVVLFSSPRDDYDTVGKREDAARLIAIDHLREHGHRKVGFLCAPPSRVDPTSPDQFEPLRVLNSSGIFAGPQWVAWQGDTGRLDDYAEAISSFTDNWLAADEADRPTAVMTLNDSAAMVALGHFASRGIRVPQDLSVIGHDNLPEAAHLVPPLTTVDGDTDGQVRAAVELLSQRVAGSRDPVTDVQLVPQLKLRGSVAAVSPRPTL